MRIKPVDLSVLKEFDFPKPPVGVRFSYEKPEGIERTPEKFRICEFVWQTWLKSEPFYAEMADILCVGRVVLGMIDRDLILESGLLGPKFGLFEARVNQALYRVAPRLPKSSCRYVSFAPLDNMPFDPDLLLITSDDINQTYIFERAISYSTLHLLRSTSAPAVACAWVFAGPYMDGEMNYVVTGPDFGGGFMEDNLIILTIPYQLLPALVRSLETGKENWMPEWVSKTREQVLVDSVRDIKELETLTGSKSESSWEQ